MDEITGDLLKLSLINDLGAVRLNNLLEYFGTTRNILQAKEDELRRIPGIGKKLSSQISSLNGGINIEKEIEKLERDGISVVTVYDKNYPVNLKSIYDSPFILYVKGEIIPEDAYAVSVVGTRRATSYGRTAAERISTDLAKRNVTIVSGLARGIDTIAHQSALACGGRTIAVLGSGLGVCYPPENKRLFERITHNGAVISEFPLMAGPEKRNFPMRNRIISGLGLGTVVVEAPVRSGALITADTALEQGREVFAVPGSVFSENSTGTHLLIKQGAKLVEDYKDIIEEIDSLGRMVLQKDNAVHEVDDEELTGVEEKIYSLLSLEPVQIDSISRKTELPVKDVSIILMGLEVKGRIREVPGKRYIRRV